MNPPSGTSIRVMTYNVHGCVGIDGKRSVERIAEVIARTAPDIVGLQELDLGRRRSAGVDQSALIAERLGYHFHFHPAMKWADEHYGDALLSRWPMTLQRCADLPSKMEFPCPEARGAMWFKVTTPHGPLHMMNTHFGLGREERMMQAEALVGPDWFERTPLSEPLVVLGDFNSLPNSAPYRMLTRRLKDSASRSPNLRRVATFPSFAPAITIDYIFVNRHVQALQLFRPRGLLGRVASDHLALCADIELVPEPGEAS
jgi:endonuclease/exonuclease/phosphatase family metal-dependent hydrolase